MTSPNAALQAALSRFSSEPGASSEQQARLRATLDADQDLLERLNEQAAAGHLSGFALGQAGHESLAGSYNKSSGVVTLPAIDAGTGPDESLRGALRLQEMSIRFAHSTYTDSNGQSHAVTQDMVTNLQATINGSPTLASEMKRAVVTTDSSNVNDTGNGRRQRMLLENFAPLSGTVAGGTFNPGDKTMSIPPATLNQPADRFMQSSAAADLTFVLGHETQHAFNQVDVASAYSQFDASVKAIARDNNPVNDYTLPIETLIASNREDEAKAQIAGWNALVDRVRQTDPAADMTAMRNLRIGRTDDFIEVDPQNPRHARPRSGFEFNENGSLSMTAQNITTQANYYFDKPPVGTPGLARNQTTGIGFHGDSDYPNYYGAGAVSRAIAFDRAYAHPISGVEPQFHIDMQRLRLSERLLEHNGITLPQATATTPQTYWDTSTTPPTRGLFQHTRDSHEHTYPTPEFSAQPARPEHPGSADKALFDKICSGVRELDRSVGKSWDDNSERLSASLLVLATQKGFTAKDDVRVASNMPNETVAGGEFVHIWRCGHPSPDPASNRAHMPMQEALSMSAEQRLAQLDALQQTKAEQIGSRQQQDVELVESGPARSM
ncbi:XVIPCD domain-containing protein [Stenotrophomonas sp.]|uniref:XVIPCD domain-containing protein n=1 Tax=Stenotrophomonas sp. TaxID=69392 RepID=UPI0028AAB996|nr:XVIPCD domain-containing protein [Stenotrophomonas sp.]